MYTFTAGLHMMFCGILLCIRYALNDLYVYVSKRILEHMHIFTVIYNDLKCFMNVLFTSLAILSLINERIIFLWSWVADIVSDYINKSLAHCENPRGSLHSLWTVDSPFLLFFPYVIMDDLYDYIDDAVVAGTVDLDEDPVAAYLGYDVWGRCTPIGYFV